MLVNVFLRCKDSTSRENKKLAFLFRGAVYLRFFGAKIYISNKKQRFI